MNHSSSEAYDVELLLKDKPKLEAGVIARYLTGQFPSIADKVTEQNFWSFYHNDKLMQMADGQKIPAVSMVFLENCDNIERLSDCIKFSKELDNAQEIASQCEWSLRISTVALSLPPSDELEIVNRLVSSLISLVDCKAIAWLPAMQMLTVAQYLGAAGYSEAEKFRVSACNVRYFNVGGSEDESIMDTVGLSALGILDLQCHFRQLPVNQVGMRLYNTAWYIVERNIILKDGELWRGLAPAV